MNRKNSAVGVATAIHCGKTVISRLAEDLFMGYGPGNTGEWEWKRMNNATICQLKGILIKRCFRSIKLPRLQAGPRNSSLELQQSRIAAMQQGAAPCKRT